MWYTSTTCIIYWQLNFLRNASILYFLGNWSPSDYPNGTSWQPYKESGSSINRDLQIVMEQADLAAYFATVYNADWAMGKEWKPRSHVHIGPEL